MANECAYCRKTGKITREHLYPKFLYRRMGSGCLGYNEAADKVTLGERKVTDVCASCNNGPLSALDGYGQRYFNANNLEHSFKDEAAVEVLYDYDLLLRWVLKISYNSFRTVDFSDNPFASLVPYILTGKNRPKEKFVKLMIEIIRGYKLRENDPVEDEFAKDGFIPCHILRSGRVVTSFPGIPCHCRHFQLNAHLFTLFLFPYSTRPMESERAMRLFQQQFPDAIILNPRTEKMLVRISSRDFMDIHDGVHVHPKERYREMEYAARRR